MRYVIHNHVGGFNAGLISQRDARKEILRLSRIVKPFQAIQVHDHGPHCKGGTDCCDDCRSKAKDQLELTNVAIDVVYTKGGYGRPKIRETRHYVRTGVQADSRGHPPASEFIHTLLSANREHKKMLLDGWEPEKIEGYYRK